MSAILTTFGIDWHLLVINIINFAVLLFGLWYFLYGPVMRMLEERRVKIAHGVEAADRAQTSLKEIESAKSTKLAQAGKEADEMLARARIAATAKEKEMRDAAERSIESLLKGAEVEAAEVKAKAIAESKQEVAKLIVLGMEKALK
ncbi:MAG TPA: ATP synthase F0 subunit B [Candidatus Paceibacterota bacterium]|jgi:F-type H+-transporting ATPase subunit b|nr:ATP synthase F0 subunit B [Candidatus Paceibacterota bacterium]